MAVLRSFPSHVETARLVGERPRPEDLPALQALIGDPGIPEAQYPAHLRTPGRTRLVHERAMRHWDEHGFGTWTMRERATGEVVGRAGLQVTDVGEGPAVEVGWFVARDRWGRGYAPELAGAALEHASADLLLQEVVAVTLHANTASQRVMAKLGLEPAGEVEHAGLPHRLFRRRAADGDGAGPEASAAPMAPPGPSG